MYGGSIQVEALTPGLGAAGLKIFVDQEWITRQAVCRSTATYSLKNNFHALSQRMAGAMQVADDRVLQMSQEMQRGVDRQARMIRQLRAMNLRMLSALRACALEAQSSNTGAVAMANIKRSVQDYEPEPQPRDGHAREQRQRDRGHDRCLYCGHYTAGYPVCDCHPECLGCHCCPTCGAPDECTCGYISNEESPSDEDSDES